MTDTLIRPVQNYFIHEFPRWTVTLEDRRETDDQSIEITLTRPGHHNFDCDDLRFVSLLIRSRLMIAAFSTHFSEGLRLTHIDIRLLPIPICLMMPTL